MPLLLLLVATLPVLVGWRFGTLAVSPAGMARFARRHRLAVTPTDQQHLLAHLGRFRRWRTAGLLVGYLLSLGWLLPQQRIAVQVVPLLGGWFVGTVVAAIRSRPPSVTGAAPADAPVVPRWLLRVPAALAAAAVAVTALMLVLRPADDGRGQLLAWATGALACAALIAATARRVRDQQVTHQQAADQPLADGPAADAATAVTAATGAHSIGAVTAAGCALGISCLVQQLGGSGLPVFDTVATAVGGIGLLWTVGALVLAWALASASRHGGRPGRAFRQLGPALLVVAVLVSTSAAWVGYALRHDQPPYPAATVRASATIRITDADRFEHDARALGVTGLTGWSGGPTDRPFVGRVDYAAPVRADGTFHVLVIDRREDRVAPLLYGTDGGMWDGVLDKLPGRYTWLSTTTPATGVGGAEFAHDGLAVSRAADAPGPVTFAGSFPDAVGLSPDDLMVVLVFVGPDRQTYWATPVPTRWVSHGIDY